MKILHTSDWHIGHRLHEQSQYEEQHLFLNWLVDFINSEKVDALLISGDIFDTGTPSSQSLELYYNFLIQLQASSCQKIFITGGNHDAPGTLNAPKEILKALSIHVVGKASDNVADEVFELNIGNESALIAAVPYLRDQDIRRAVAGESFNEIGDRYKAALISHYNEVAKYCAQINKKQWPLIAMGHLFAVGGTTSDSEQSIYVGNAGDIGADDFSRDFDYVALGHLHRHQAISKRVRYSGTPYVLSFSEVGHTKQLISIDINENKIANISDHSIPEFRPIHKVEGSFEECSKLLQKLDQEEHQLTPWVEVVLDEEGRAGLSFSTINEVTDTMSLKVLKVTLKNQGQDYDSFTSESEKDVKDFTPMEVFKLKCEEEGFDINANPDIEDAFHEVLQMAKEQ